MWPAFHLMIVLAASGLPPSVIARSEAAAQATEKAEDLDTQGRQAEQLDDFAAAVGFYKQALKADPSSPVAKFAKERVDWLESRSEDGYRPLVELTKEKRIHLIQLTRAEVERFERAVDGYPRGIVRREARAWIAERWLRTVRDPARAIQACRTWLDEPGLDDMEKLLAKADLEQAQKNAAPAPPPSAPTTTRTADHPMSGPRPGLGRVRHIGVFVSGGVFVLAALAAVSLRRRRPGRARTAGIVGTSVVAGLALVFLVLAHTALLDPLLRSIAP